MTTVVHFAAYDMEHNRLGIELIRSLIGQLRNLYLPVWVRPLAAKYHLIAPPLDIGSPGVIAPMVERAEDAVRVTNACRYYPRGRRGVVFSMVHDDYAPGDAAAKIKTANEEVICSLPIGTDRAITNLYGILAVPDIDLIWV
jgi:4-hydroxy-2-oxoheptanedioate aldolase